jgi:hypothetical protein
MIVSADSWFGHGREFTVLEVTCLTRTCHEYALGMHDVLDRNNVRNSSSLYLIALRGSIITSAGVAAVGSSLPIFGRRAEQESTLSISCNPVFELPLRIFGKSPDQV